MLSALLKAIDVLTMALVIVFALTLLLANSANRAVFFSFFPTIVSRCRDLIEKDQKIFFRIRFDIQDVRSLVR